MARLTCSGMATRLLLGISAFHIQAASQELHDFPLSSRRSSTTALMSSE